MPRTVEEIQVPFGFVKILVRIIIIIVVERFWFRIIFMMITEFNNLEATEHSMNRWTLLLQRLTGPKIEAFTFGKGIGTSPTSITEMERDASVITSVMTRLESYNPRGSWWWMIVQQRLGRWKIFLHHSIALWSFYSFHCSNSTFR